MAFAVYVLCAFIQAVLIQRYVIQDREPVSNVVMMMILAPITMVVLIGWSFGKMIIWLTTYKSKNTTKY